MTFKDIRQGYTIFVLDREDGMVARTGKATAVGAPHFPQMPGGVPGMMQTAGMVVDVTVEVDGIAKTYSVPEGSTVASAGMTTLCADRDSMLREVDAAKTASEDAIKTMARHEKVKADCVRILEEWNPDFAEKKRQDERIVSIETQMKDVHGMLQEIMQRLDKD